MNPRAKFVVVISSTFLVLLLLLGAVVGKSAAPDGSYRQLAVYTEVLSRIKSEYVEEPDMKSVTLGALNGLLESVDPFSSYLNADQYKEYLKNYESSKGDVGLVLSKRFGYIGVVGAIPGSPAGKAGLTTGDMIETIKGIATRDMPLAYANMLLRGQPGSSVEITVLRRRPEPQKVTLERAVLQDPVVSSKMLPNDVGYIRAETLSRGKVQQIAAAISELQNKGAKRLILDLRYCALGAPEDGVALANLFLDKGLIAYVQGQRWNRQDFKADAAKKISNLPLEVLVNRGTADGAEVAAAALQDDKRAELVGERTYGNASIRKAITMDDGGAIILSVAKYYSPNGKAIQGENAVTPGTVVAEAEAQPDTDDNGEPVTPDNENRKPTGDPILERAIRLPPLEVRPQ